MRGVKGFTLIELLVVISIITLLMAILLPTLQHVGKQAKAVACQSNLRQWGLAFSMYTTDNESKFFGGVGTGPYWPEQMYPYYSNCKDILLCPMALKYSLKTAQEHYHIPISGSKFHAWEATGYPLPSSKILGSYGLSVWVMDFYDGTYDPWLEDVSCQRCR